MPIQQPFLHDLAICVQAPATLLSGLDGQVREAGVQGMLHADLRVLSRAELTVAGVAPEPVAGGATGGPGASFTGLVRALGDDGADPTVRVDRSRLLSAIGGDAVLAETVTVTSTALGPVRAEVALAVAVDLAPVHEIKDGAPRPPRLPARIDTGTGALCWARDGVEVSVTGDGGVSVGADGSPVLSWPVDLPGPGSVTLTWQLTVRDAHPVVMAPPSGPAGWPLRVEAADVRLPALLERSLLDLDALRLAAPSDEFFAAGAPWFLTLFGRDSLWAARMTLPLGTALAAGTLRTLAARQGRRTDPRTGEAPGKILHELRRGTAEHQGGAITLPPVYYGTVDATALWVCLLHDAWKWGMPAAEVAALLPAAEAALDWIEAATPPDGFLAYVDESGSGLANQGWKDSGDAVRYADGGRAAPPVALCEVQGYAYEAAVHGADLLDAFGRPGGDRRRAWAAALAERFRARFWVDGSYPALALDRDGRPADVVTSNIGHLLGTGLLSAAEEGRIADLLTGPDLLSGYGLRTMSDRAVPYAPLSYHCGSVWPHDTAIALHGLVRSGHAAAAARLVPGLLAAGAAFGNRLPELWSGDAGLPWPVPYPAACRPQAWSAAAAVVLVQALLGLDVDVPAGRLDVRPLPGGLGGPYTVRGLRVGDRLYDVHVDAEDHAEMTETIIEL